MAATYKNFPLTIPALLHPSLLLHVQYSIKILYVPVLIRQNLSSPSIPGSPIHAHERKYLHSPWTFWRIFLHIVALTPGKCSFDSTCLQSVIESVLLSNGSAHFGSESLRHSQHFIENTEIYLNFYKNCVKFFILKFQLSLMLGRILTSVHKQNLFLPVCAANTSNIPATIKRWVLFIIIRHYLGIADGWNKLRSLK